MEEEFIKIPKWSLKLLKIEGYFERYHFHCQELNKKGELTYEKAWKATEQELFSFFELNRYEDYHSFRSAKHYHQRKRVDKNAPILTFI